MITMTPYALVDSDGFVRQQSRLEESDGPNAPYEIIGLQCHKLAGPLDWSVATQTKRYKWVGGAPVLVETGSVADLAAAAIAKTFVDVDEVTLAAVGQRRGEYEDAEVAARAWAASGYVGEPAEDVTGYATFNGTGQLQTNRWAADTIIARATAFKGAQLAMRSKRFERQCGMQAAPTTADLAAVVAQWDSFIDGLRSQLGLPPKGTV